MLSLTMVMNCEVVVAHVRGFGYTIHRRLINREPINRKDHSPGDCPSGYQYLVVESSGHLRAVLGSNALQVTCYCNELQF